MATIVSASEFRSRMGAMLALADKGEQVVIKRRSSPSYVLHSSSRQRLVYAIDDEK